MSSDPSLQAAAVVSVYAAVYASLVFLPFFLWIHLRNQTLPCGKVDFWFIDVVKMFSETQLI